MEAHATCRPTVTVRPQVGEGRVCADGLCAQWSASVATQQCQTVAASKSGTATVWQLNQAQLHKGRTRDRRLGTATRPRPTRHACMQVRTWTRPPTQRASASTCMLTWHLNGHKQTRVHTCQTNTSMHASLFVPHPAFAQRISACTSMSNVAVTCRPHGHSRCSSLLSWPVAWHGPQTARAADTRSQPVQLAPRRKSATCKTHGAMCCVAVQLTSRCMPS
ncbi:hypothetical protein COO60DRAFT_865604 [Scenedesmus sp. NREL 46B-D3]|nr:hypothetical protein COO60DRAFT_865604 [Scenedesmus sp. NREL 46B-D3]